MKAPLVFGLEYYGPRLPTGPGTVNVQLNYIPNCLKAPTRPSHLATHFPMFPGFPSGQSTFSSKVSAGTCAVQKRGQDQACCLLPIRGHTVPQSVLPLCWLQSALLCKPPLCNLKMDKKTLIEGGERKPTSPTPSQK